MRNKRTPVTLLGGQRANLVVKTGMLSDDKYLSQRMKRYSRTDRDPKAAFEKSIAQITEHLQNKNKLLLLSIADLYRLITAATEGEWTENTPFYDSSMELLISLALREHLDSSDVTILRREDPSQFLALAANREQVYEPLITNLKELLFDITSSYLSDLRNQRQQADAETSALLESVDNIRVYTHTVRNWSTPDYQHFFLTRMLAPLDEEARNRLGISPVRVVELLSSILDLCDKRTESFIDARKGILQARTLEAAFQSYFRAVAPQFADIQFKDASKNIERTKSALADLSLLALPSMRTFKIEELSELYGEPSHNPSLEKLINEWSHQFGELSSIEPKSLVLQNPIWKKPFIKVEEMYFLPAPSMLMSFMWELIETLLSVDDQLKKKFEDRRASFLEEEVQRVLSEKIPDGQVFAGSMWKENSTVYENDLLLVIDTFAIVIECKAGRASESSMRGGDKAIQTTVKRLLTRPSEQSARFRDMLMATRGKHSFATKRGVTNNVDMTNVQHCLRLTITLDPFSNVFCQKALLNAGLLGKPIDLAPAMTLYDFETCMDVLPEVCQRLHYLERRNTFENEVNYGGDELDLLSYYLQTGLRIADNNPDYFHLLIGASILLSRYIVRNGLGRDVKCPQREMTAMWTGFIEALPSMNAQGWTSCASCLLNFAIDVQVQVESFISSARHDLRHRLRQQEIAMRLFNPTSGGRSLLMCVYSKCPIDSVSQQMLSRLRDHPEAIGLAVNVRRPRLIAKLMML